MGYIDVDTHVLECEQTWEYMDPSEAHYKPRIMDLQGEVGDIATGKSLWLTGDGWARRWPADGRPSGYGKTFSGNVTYLEDPAERLRDMDELGVDAQIVISTFFIGIESAHPLEMAALTRSWNRWVAERTADAGGRLRWLGTVPLMHRERAFEELAFMKEHGAAGVMIHGFPYEMYLNDPWFYPIYERAQDLDLTVGVHLGAPVRIIPNLPIGNLVPTPPAFLDHAVTNMKGMHAILSSDLSERFPRLRWAFLESGATWVPAIIQQHQRLISLASPEGFPMTERGTTANVTRIDGPKLMAEKNVYVACETDEDLPYLAGLLGEDCLMFGSDYCHNDIGADPFGHTIIAGRDDVKPELAEKITSTNARKAFGIPLDFQPASVAARKLSA
ncbi:MAG: amidohydrolase family protein [Acidimicrobiia bacterium]